MGFLGFGTPRYRHRDPATRIDAINALTYDRQELFSRLACEDPDARVRNAAAQRVTDPAALQQLLGATDPEVVRLARERLGGVALSIALTRPLAACQAVLDTITQQKSLTELTLQAADEAVRAAAFRRLLSLPDVSQAMLAVVAIQDGQGAFAQAAVAALDKRGLLKDVARKAKLPAVRTAAQARLAEREAADAQPTPEQRRRQRRVDLEPLQAAAIRLGAIPASDRLAAAAAELGGQRDALQARYADLPADGQDAAGLDRIERAVRDASLRIAEHRRLQADALARRDAFLAEHERPLPAAEELALGALEAAWQRLPRPEPLADQTDLALAARLQDERFAALVAARRLRQSELRDQAEIDLAHAAPASAPAGPGPGLTAAEEAELQLLVTESETLADSSDWRGAQDRFRVVHKRWSQLSAGCPGDHPLRSRFLAAYTTFKERRRAHRDSRTLQHRERLDALRALADEAEALAATVPQEGEQRAFLQRLRDLQSRWQAVGAVPVGLVLDVRGRFRAACDAALVPVRALIEQEDWERFAHLTRAEALIGEVEALSAQTDLVEVARQLRRLHAAWKQNGPLPRSRRDEVLARFRAACDAQHARTAAHFAALDAQREAHRIAKQALIDEVERLLAAGPVGLAGSPADLAQRRQTLDRVKAIQQAWKAIGPAPRDAEQALWMRFRAACDHHFARSQEEQDQRRQELVANAEAKRALCVAAEAAAQQAETGVGAMPPGARLQALKELQARWKTIGHVPRDEMDSLWTRFRSACDRVYATLADHLAQQEAVRRENLARKQALIVEAEEILNHEHPGWFKDDLRDIQQRWREIGHVPREHMDELANRFQAICDRVFAL